jgi:hypothetical protein
VIIRALIYGEGQINALDQVQKKAAEFINCTKDSDWETLALHRMHTLGNGLRKLYATGCEGLNTWARFIMFRKLGTGSRNGYRVEFLCKYDHKKLEPTTCRSVGDFPM